MDLRKLAEYMIINGDPERNIFEDSNKEIDKNLEKLVEGSKEDRNLSGYKGELF